jgi:sec-independent protein translocase protein TatA
MPGPTELLLILLIVVVVFGAKRIPEIMGGLGKGIRTFKKSMDEDDPPAAPPTQPPAATGEPSKEKIEPK